MNPVVANRVHWLSACLLALALVDAQQLQAADSKPALTASDYARAERLLPWNRDKWLRNAYFQHYWIGGEDRFWYRRVEPDGSARFVVVDAASGRRRPAFDQERIAAGLSKAFGRPVKARALPFVHFRYVQSGAAIEFLAEGRRWSCTLDGAQCTAQEALETEPGHIVSPDGRWSAFIRDDDVWVRANDGSGEFALTQDGERNDGYAASAGNNVQVDPLQRYGVAAPALRWSADSTRILTHRLDERRVEPMHLLQAVPDGGSVRPRLFSYRYSMPNEEHKALARQMVFDVRSRRKIDLGFPAAPILYQAPLESGYSWWSQDGTRVYYLERGPYYRTLRLWVGDAATGEARSLITESSPTYIEPAGIGRLPMVRMLANGDVIWFSEADGWGHLYLYDGKSGRLKNQITRGSWRVRSIVRVDERERTIYFTASGREPGRNPYLRHFYRSRFDGSELTLLTPEDAEHRIATSDEDIFGLGAAAPLASDAERQAFSPSGRYFLDTYSRPDLPARTVLKKSSGHRIADVETTDISKLQSAGFRMPEPFEVVSADGTSRLFGVILLPSNFDPSKRYAVIDSVYPGPQITRVQYDFAQSVFDPMGASALAELGFVVVALDARGTPLRSKAFLDHSYGKLAKASDLDDHVTALRQLARTRPWMDLDRVGVAGQSGGGYAAARAMLEHADFYKVGVASAGNHDPRGYLSVWGETYIGPDDGRNYIDAANASLAVNLSGDLLLIHGETDHNVHPSQTMRLVDALVQANRDFDLLILPNVGHGFLLGSYATRRQWDYFVRHLMDAQPPLDYRIADPASAAN